MTTQLIASTEGKYKEKKVDMAIFVYLDLNGNHNLIDNKTHYSLHLQMKL